MSCPNDATLWSFLEGGLDAADRAAIDDHLSGCPACQASLQRVQATRAVLRGAGAVPVEVDWRRADEAVPGAATVRFARSARWRVPVWGLTAALVAAGVALMVWAPWATHPVSPDAPVLSGAVVESLGGGSTLRSATNEPLALVEGAGVPGGATLSTAATAPTVLRLPEQSRARLAPQSSASILRATKEEIALRLQSGTVTVKAAHVPRKEFLVDAEAAQVRVVGTAFRVRRDPDRVIVTVAEGRVLVEPKDGPGRLIDAGHTVAITSDGTWAQDALDAQWDDTSDFDALGVALARAVPEPKDATPAVAIAEPPRRERPHVPPARPASDQPPAAALTTPDIPATPPVPDTAPAPPEPAPAAATASAATDAVPTTAEALFLARAQAALKTGRCQNYQLGLQDVVEGSEDRNAREIAQILRARCFDDQLEPAAALREYRKYLERFPNGRFAAEAHKALGD
ncbi:MAG: FecR domain-containing protein [Myxococcaceae bacterium]|nr:FecR domain-containing protein [Myxococcaceae bacterium]